MAAYRTDCYAARAVLNPAYHPTLGGVLKVIHHQGEAQAAQIGQEWRKR